MREEVFEALAPICPRCRHGEGRDSPLVIADRSEMRAGHLWHGILHCSDPGCWMEFPVVDGIPVIVADPRSFLAGTQVPLQRPAPLPAPLTGLLADAMGPGSEFDVTRQHLSLYAGDHYSDWGPEPRPSNVAATLAAGIDLLGGVPAGPAIDLGGSVGRGGWELGRLSAAPVVVADLNLSMLRLGQRLAVDGAAEIDLRRVGVVYDRVRIEVPEAMGAAAPDFWAVDAMALPFATGRFATAAAINLVDCVATPMAVIAEAARILAPGGAAVLSTPYDWSPNATPVEHWLGGHSQRGPWQGASEPVLREALSLSGMPVVGEALDVPWHLRMHARATMEYRMHLVACRRVPSDTSAAG